jgi:uncharacterized protein
MRGVGRAARLTRATLAARRCDNPGMRVVVSGASGLLGSALVPALARAGHEVVRLVRREPAAADEVGWHPDEGTIDSDALRGVDAAVMVSGANIGRRWTTARKAEILASRVDTTRLLAQTLALLEPRPQVLLSAGGVGIYGDRGDEILTEESELGSDGFLPEVGKAWEGAAQPARAAGVRVVNFRQGVVITGRGGMLDRLLTPFKLGVGGRLGSGRQWLSWVDLDDLVAAYLLALDSSLAGPVNLVSPNPVTNAQFTRALGHALHRPTALPVPAVALRTLYGQMAEEVLLEGQRALPARLLEAGFEFRRPEVAAALESALAES